MTQPTAPGGATPPASRPEMPASYGLLPQEEGGGLLPWQALSQKMAQARNYWLATSSPQGQPHAVPVWGVWLEEAFYFATDLASRKARNLAANPALALHLESGDDVVILEGVVEAVEDVSLLAQISAAYGAKYGLEMALDHAYVLRHRLALAWREQDFPGSATRWRFA